MPDPQPQTQKVASAPIRPFDALPTEIKEWLQSDSASNIIDELNEKWGLTGKQEDALAFVTTWIVLQRIKPEECMENLAKFGLTPDLTKQAAQVIQERLLRPVRGPLKERLGINTDPITMLPKPQQQATATPKPLVADIKKPQPAAQTTTFAQPINVARNTTKPQTPPAPRPAPTSPAANNSTLARPISFVEIKPLPPENSGTRVDAKTTTPTPETGSFTAPKAPPQPTPAPETGSFTIVKTPPSTQPHELTQYHDEYPMQRQS